MNFEVQTLESVPHPTVFESDVVGVVFALGIEAGSLVDRMKKVQTSSGNGLTYHRGLLGWKHFILVVSGVGQEKARKATEALHEVFQPKCILSAGFAGALDPSLHRNVVFQPKEVLSAEQSLEVPQGQSMRLLTCDHLIDTVAEKQRLWKETGANLVDMESFAVAQYCQSHRVAFSSIRIVFDLANEELAKELRGITNPESGMIRKAGAFAGAFFKRPSCVMDLLKYKERALASADRLAVEIENLFLEDA